MAHYHTEEVECPHCEKEHEIEFIFYSPDEGDSDIKEVNCECGCVFSLTCKAAIEVELYCEGVYIIKRPNTPIDSEEYHSNDPNQLSFL